jgi:hypothetical protein
MAQATKPRWWSILNAHSSTAAALRISLTKLDSVIARGEPKAGTPSRAKSQAHGSHLTPLPRVAAGVRSHIRQLLDVALDLIACSASANSRESELITSFG